MTGEVTGGQTVHETLPPTLGNTPHRSYTEVVSYPAVLAPLPQDFPAATLPPRTDIIAHRGGAHIGPENTMVAFDRARSLGIETLETDVQITADGVAIAFHDETLDRVTNMSGPVRAYTWDEVRRATVYGPNGSSGSIPRITDLLAEFDTNWVIDLKNGDSIVPLANAINAAGAASRTCVAHSWDTWLERVRELTSPALERMVGWKTLAGLIAYTAAGLTPPKELFNAPWVHIAWKAGGFALMKRRSFADRLISACHDHGVGVRVWTINNEKRIRRLVDQGVDGIFTDVPDLGLSLVRV